MNATTFYLTASSKQKGALGIFHVHGEEAVLARFLDARLGGKASARGLVPHELRYGWLRDGAGDVIDEVMLAAPVAGARVLMTHGGRVIREQVEAYFGQCGFSAISFHPNELNRLLASCVTEGQVAAVLAGKYDVFTRHRVVLAGAPNAGKSSLLNALAGYDRAFVDAEAGATRDVVDELIDLAGYPVWVGDMPGYMGGDSGLGAEAWGKAVQRLRLAEEVWFVVDGSEEWGGAADAAAAVVSGAVAGRPVLIIINKADQPLRLVGRPWERWFPGAPVLSVSTLSDGNAVDALERYVAGVWGTANRNRYCIFNESRYSCASRRNRSSGTSL